MTSDKDIERRMEKRSRAPYWWPDLQSLMQFLLAGAIVWMVGYILTRLFAGGEVKIDPTARDLVMIIIGIILGAFKDVFGFTFGSSAADKQKSETINRSIDTKDKIIATNVEAAAAVAAAAVAAPGSAGSMPWWGVLRETERFAITAAVPTDPRVAAFHVAAQTGKALPEDLDYLVTKGLLTQARADEVKATA